MFDTAIDRAWQREEVVLGGWISQTFGVGLHRSPSLVCPVDYLATRGQSIAAVIETKTRIKVDWARLWSEGLILSSSKLSAGLVLSKLLAVPFVVVVAFPLVSRVAVLVVSDTTGRPIVPFEVRDSSTQRSANGGQITRSNAYLDLRWARWYVR